MRARGVPPGRLAAFVLAVAAGVTALSPAQAAGGARPAGGRPASASASAATSARPRYVPPIGHVFVVNIENKGYAATFGAASAAPYLAKTLRRKGVLLTSYYGVAHNSLANYIAQISGQAPDAQTQADCQVFSPFVTTGPPQAPGQAVGNGCVFPKGVPSLATQLSRHGITWRGYMQQMSRPCEHPRLGGSDPTQHATRFHNYAVRHDPFMYFRSIIHRAAYCRGHVRPLADLATDLEKARTTPHLSYITPDLCADGHDDPCASGAKGGLVQVDHFLRVWAPRILSSPAYRRNGMLVITADEATSPQADSTSCCGETAGPNLVLGTGPGILGPGGGLTGALVLSHFTRADTWSTTSYNHYSLLASIEQIFGLPELGMASVPGLPVFGLDIYNDGWWQR